MCVGLVSKITSFLDEVLCGIFVRDLFTWTSRIVHVMCGISADVSRGKFCVGIVEVLRGDCGSFAEVLWKFCGISSL